MKKGIFWIEVIIKTPRITITNRFDLSEYANPEEWIKAAKNWIKEETD